MRKFSLENITRAQLLEWLEWLETAWSYDPDKLDKELICGFCGMVICDVENDSLGLLMRTALADPEQGGHMCPQLAEALAWQGRLPRLRRRLARLWRNTLAGLRDAWLSMTTEGTAEGKELYR